MKGRVVNTVTRSYLCVYFVILCLSVALQSVAAWAEDTPPPPPEDPGIPADSVLHTPLTTPSSPKKVFISGQPVLTKSDNAFFENERLRKMLPESLKTDRAKIALSVRTQLQVYEHNPKKGPKDAPITVVELNDLSCIQCQETLQKSDEIINKYGDNVRYIFIHLPIDLYNTTNPAAFYGRLAHQSGVFWEYRKALQSLDEVGDSAYVQKLLEAGVDVRNMRKQIRQNARQFYRELDADTILAKKLGETRPPVLFVNGIRVGGGITIDEVGDLIDYELKVRRDKTGAIGHE